MSSVKVNPGVCGFECRINAVENDEGNMDIHLDTQCPHIKEMEKDLQNIDGMQEIFGGFSESKVYESARKNCKHLACPTPSAIVKAIEVQCKLALPRNVEMDISK